MSGRNDSNIKLLYPVDQNSFFALDIVEAKTAFDVIANVEIGSNINQYTNSERVVVAVTNLMTGVVTTSDVTKPLTAALTDHLEEIRVPFLNGVDGSDGDVLQAVASYTVSAGVNSDLSVETSEYFLIGKL